MNRNEYKKMIHDLVMATNPKFDFATAGSATNRIAEYLDDLANAYDEAVRFIEDPHDGIYGVVLEYLDKDGKWKPSEIADDCPLYYNFHDDSYTMPQYLEDDVQVGLYENWGDCWGNMAGDDWDSRLGVWKAKPTQTGEEVIGESEERIVHKSYGDFKEGGNDIGRYRMRRIPVGQFSAKAKKWMYEHIDLFRSVRDLALGGI